MSVMKLEYAERIFEKYSDI